MVIVCAVSDGYYLPAPLTLLYASCLLSPSRPPSLSLIHTISRSLLLPLLYTVLFSILNLSLSLPYFLLLLYSASFFLLFTFCLLFPVISISLSRLH